jgi:hypothetical protein
MTMGYSSSDSLDHHHMQPQPCYETSGLPSKSNLSNIGVPKTERSSIDASVRTSSSEEEDHSGELSISNASDMEWVEQDEPGVYITIRALPGGTRELRRVRFRFVEIVRMENKLLFKETSVSFKFKISFVYPFTQPREVWRNACEIMVGREPCEDTRAIFVTMVMSLYTHNCFRRLTREDNVKALRYCEF